MFCYSVSNKLRQAPSWKHPSLLTVPQDLEWVTDSFHILSARSWGLCVCLSLALLSRLALHNWRRFWWLLLPTLFSQQKSQTPEKGRTPGSQWRESPPVSCCGCTRGEPHPALSSGKPLLTPPSVVRLFQLIACSHSTIPSMFLDTSPGCIARMWGPWVFPLLQCWPGWMEKQVDKGLPLRIKGI